MLFKKKLKAEQLYNIIIRQLKFLLKGIDDWENIININLLRGNSFEINGISSLDYMQEGSVVYVSTKNSANKLLEIIKTIKPGLIITTPELESLFKGNTTGTLFIS